MKSFASPLLCAILGCSAFLSPLLAQADPSLMSTKPLHVLATKERSYNAPTLLVFSPDSKTLASGGENCQLQFWDVATGKEKTGLARSFESTYGLGFSPNGRLFATSGSELIGVQLWDARTGRLVRTLKEPYPASKNKHVQDFSFSPDGKTLMASASCCEVQRWDVNSGKLLGKFKATKKFYSFVLSPDGKTFATASPLHEDANNCVDKTVGYLWDARTGQLKRTLPDMGWPMTFSPDNSQLITRLVGPKDDSHLGIWSVSSDKRLKRSAESITANGSAGPAMLSPNGRLLVTGQDNKLIRVLDAQSGKSLQTLTGDESILSVAFSPNGSLLATGEDNGHIHLWSLR